MTPLRGLPRPEAKLLEVYHAGMKRSCNRYANNAAIEAIPALAPIYCLAYPIARLAKLVGLSPNQLTFLSLTAGALAALALWSHNLGLFTVLWLISFLVDFADGTLARMNGKESHSELDWDHLSDLLKFGLILTGLGLHFDSELVWPLVAISILFFFYYSLVNENVGNLKRKAKLTVSSPESRTTRGPGSRIGRAPSRRAKSLQRFWVRSVELSRILAITLLSIHAHTSIIFLFAPLSESLAVTLLTYFIFICFRSTIILLFRAGGGANRKQQDALPRKTGEIRP